MNYETTHTWTVVCQRRNDRLRGRPKILLPETHKDIAPYVLESAKGIRYALTRNVPNPDALFGIRFTGGMGILPGWFSDKGGELKSLG